MADKRGGKKRYRYVGLTADGYRKEGFIEAASGKEAKALLENSGIRPEKVEQLTVRKGLPVSRKKVLFATRSLVSMLRAGVPLTTALGILAGQWPGRIGRAFRDIGYVVEAGGSLESAFADYSFIFDPLLPKLVGVGEKTGRLDEVLARWVEYTEKNLELKRKARSAMMYPLIVLVVALGIGLLLMFKVVPKFSSIFSSAGGQLPSITRGVLNTSNWLRAHTAWVFGIIVLLVVGGLLLPRAASFRKALGYVAMKIPGIKTLVSKIIIARSLSIIVTMVEAGLPPRDAFEGAARGSMNPVFEKAWKQVAADVDKGDRISVAMAATGVFPSIVSSMMNVVEETGDIAQSLSGVARMFEEEVDGAVRVLTGLLEPAMLLGIGGMVAVILIALYLPIFKLASTLH